ncbi:MAG: malectin domain-containing carbohydrate-binding protein [Pirellulales bacterium]
MRNGSRFATALFFIAIGGFALDTGLLRGDVTLAPVIGSNMVLQRDKPVPIWGTADAGEKVTVKFSGQTKTAVAGKDGRWRVTLDPLAAEPDQTGQSMQVQAANTIAIENILVGEVWLCSGQSNMEWTVGQSTNAAAEIAAAEYPQIRHIKIGHTPAAKPLATARTGGWQECSPQTAGGFTGVGYYFGRKINKELKVPIGLIGSNWGGTRIEPWIPPQGFRSVEALKNIADNLDQFPKGSGNRVQHQSALALYNGMIHPLVPFAIRGAVWYQGESNMGEGMLYHEKMKALITGWRQVWGQQDQFPFYWVQLAPFTGYGGGALPAIWEAQTATLSVPNTGMSVTTDITGNMGDIHPRNKQDVGKRLALWALAKTYGHRDLIYSGPLYQSMRIEGDKIRLFFAHTGTGLKSRDGKDLDSFTIADAGGQFAPATATIDGMTVVVRGPTVKSPTQVRFGWHKLANPNLCNSEGLPAAPFRTENWRGGTGLPPGPGIVFGGRPLVVKTARFKPKSADAKWSGQVFYRATGTETFSSATAELSDDGQLVATIPAEATQRPFEYYIQFKEESLPALTDPPAAAKLPHKVVPDLQPPTAVTDLASPAVSDFGVTLRWEAATDDHRVTGYRIFRGDRDGFAASKNNELGNVPDRLLEFIDSAPPVGKTAWYAVRAVDVVKRDGELAYLKVDVPPNRPPKNPFKLAAVAAGKRAFLRWSGSLEPDVVAIEILRGTGGDSELKLLATVDDLAKTTFADEGLQTDTDYRYAVRLRDSGDLTSAASEPQLVRPGLYLKRINCGGDEFVAADGIPWEADNGRVAGTSHWKAKTIIAAAPLDLQPMYQTERWSYQSIRYRFDLKPGAYEVVVHFAETNRTYAVKGKRTFDVIMGGSKVREAVDIFGESGGLNTAWQMVTKVKVADSPFVVELRKGQAGPALKGIEIRGLPTR